MQSNGIGGKLVSTYTKGKTAENKTANLQPLTIFQAAN